MKQFLLIPTSALVAAVVLTSCQKEEQSCTQLVNELTTVLQNVTDYDSAAAAAPRVKALMLRWQKAAVRPIDFDGTSLYASSLDEGKAYLSAIEKLAEQVARVKASYPALTHDGDIDVDRLKRAVGAAGAMKRPEAATEKKKGEAYLSTYEASGKSFDKDTNNTVNTFVECYGCADLKEALEITVKPNPAVGGVFAIDGQADVIETPEYVEPAGGEDAPAADGEADEPAVDTDEPSVDETDDTDEPTDDTTEETDETDSGDVSLDLDVDVDVDTTSDEEPAEEETTDEEPADEEPAVEETTDEEPADEEPADEEPVIEETTDDEPAVEETTDEEPAEEENSDEEPVDDVDLDMDLDI